MHRAVLVALPVDGQPAADGRPGAMCTHPGCESAAARDVSRRVGDVILGQRRAETRRDDDHRPQGRGGDGARSLGPGKATSGHRHGY
eukprot:6079475-Prymnesium_polylepis.1